MMSPQLRQIATKYCVAAYDKQTLFSQATAKARWRMSIQAGELTFSNNLTFPIQLLGVHDRTKREWWWTWGSGQNLPGNLLHSGFHLRQLGQRFHIPEFSSPWFSVAEDFEPITMLLACVGACQQDAYFGMPDGPSVVYILLKAPQVVVPDKDFAAVMSAWNSFWLTMSAGTDEKAALISYVRQQGYEAEVFEHYVRIVQPATGNYVIARTNDKGSVERVEPICTSTGIPLAEAEAKAVSSSPVKSLPKWWKLGK
jgi:hypothetical protein